MVLAEAPRCLLGSGRTSTDSDWTKLKGCTVYCRDVLIRVTELIESKKTKQLPKTLLGKRGCAGKKRTVSSRARRQWQARCGNDKSVAVIARDEKQHLLDEARQRLPLAPAMKGMRRDHKRNYLHASFVVCQNCHAFEDLGVLII